MSSVEATSATYRPGLRELIFEHSMALIVLSVPTASVLLLLSGTFHYIPGTVEICLLIIFYIVSILGVTVGFHRHFTHRSFVAKPALRIFLAFAGSIAVQGPVIRWVADHRRHHQFADKLGDPHSPHEHPREGIGDLLAGLWWAHVGWMFNSRKTVEHRYAKDLLKDPLAVFFSRNYFLWILVSLLLPAVLGFLLTLDWRVALSSMLIAGLVRIFLVHHVVWAVNSIGHTFGKRPYRTGDESTNISLLAIPTLGDSYHNNHHAFPSSAQHGVDSGQLDLGWRFIRLMLWLGLASDVIYVSESQKQPKRNFDET